MHSDYFIGASLRRAEKRASRGLRPHVLPLPSFLPSRPPPPPPRPLRRFNNTVYAVGGIMRLGI